MHFYTAILMHFYLPTFLHVYNFAKNLYIGASCICIQQIIIRKVDLRIGPIKYVPLFDNISRHLLLRRNPDFEVN